MPPVEISAFEDPSAEAFEGCFSIDAISGTSKLLNNSLEDAGSKISGLVKHFVRRSRDWGNG